MSTTNRFFLTLFYVFLVLFIASIFFYAMSVPENKFALCDQEYYNCAVMSIVTIVLAVIFGLLILVTIVKLKIIQDTSKQPGKSQNKQGKS